MTASLWQPSGMTPSTRRSKRFGAGAAALVLLATGLVSAAAQTPPGDSARAVFGDEFDAMDRRAREVVQMVRCAGLVASMRVAGTFGPTDSLGSAGHCIAAQGRGIGVFLEPDSGYTRVIRFAAVDLVTEERVLAPLDTAALLAQTRASRDAVRRGYPAYEAAERPFGPVTIRTAGDTIEVWLIPLEVLGGDDSFAVGGEHGYIYSPDGARLVREVDAFEQYRLVALSDTAEIVIQSGEPEVPLLSEMLFANLLAEADQVVTIETRRYRSILVGSGAQGIWMHVRREG